MIEHGSAVSSVGPNKAQMMKVAFLQSVTPILSLVLCTFAAATQAIAEEPGAVQSLRAFSAAWDEAGWVPKRGVRTLFMRDMADDGWQHRMRALQSLVASGKDAIAPLVKALEEGDLAQRVLAAQALGYLAPHAPRDALLEAARNDEDAAVRLYAVDSLGMQGGADFTQELQALAASEHNRDVKKHIAYALERGSEGVDPQIVHDLVDWDSNRIQSARVGHVAPDFEMTSITGERIRLSQFLGKNPVVLVFIYGDT